MMRWLRLGFVLTWALIYSRHGNDWTRVSELPSAARCQEVLDARVGDEVLGEIGGALADQPADNPIRSAAARRAERRVRERYRCVVQSE